MTIAEIRARHDRRYHSMEEAAYLLDLVARMRPWLVAQRNALETFPNGTKHPEFAALDALVEESRA